MNIVRFERKWDRMAQWVFAEVFAVGFFCFGAPMVEVLFPTGVKPSKNPGDADDSSILLSPRESLAYLFDVISQQSEFNQ